MSLRGEPLFEGLNFKELFGKELIVDKVFWSYDGISLLCVCKDEDEKLYFCNCTEVRSEERWVLYPATKQQIEQIVSKSKTPAEVFRDSRGKIIESDTRYVADSISIPGFRDFRCTSNKSN